MSVSEDAQYCSHESAECELDPFLNVPALQTLAFVIVCITKRAWMDSVCTYSCIM
jgi:hypothetical protein